MYGGLYRAIVSNINDPDKMGRIRVTIPELLGETTESAWCLPCVPVCYDNGGDFCLPKLKETVWVAFERGDLNFPVYLGNWWSPYNTPAGKDYKKDSRIINFDNCTIIMKGDTIDIEGEVNLSKLNVNGKPLYDYIKEIVEEVNNA